MQKLPVEKPNVLCQLVMLQTFDSFWPSVLCCDYYLQKKKAQLLEMELALTED